MEETQVRVDRRFGQTSDDFVAADLKQMEVATNYNQWLFALVQPHLGRRIFEVGSGIGNVTRRLVESAEFVFGIEPNLACVEQLERALGAHPRFGYRPWSIEECDPSFLARYRLDTILCTNVLEHIEDDTMTLRFFASMLQPGARLVLLLPGVSWAYGTIDTAVGHFRRYTKKSISVALNDLGLEVEFLRYSNFIGLIGWCYNGRIKHIVKQSDAQIRLFDRIVPWYSRLEEIVPPPIGMSLLVVGRKPFNGFIEP